jgi:hypothetical protein
MTRASLTIGTWRTWSWRWRRPFCCSRTAAGWAAGAWCRRWSSWECPAPTPTWRARNPRRRRRSRRGRRGWRRRRGPCRGGGWPLWLAPPAWLHGASSGSSSWGASASCLPSCPALSFFGSSWEIDEVYIWTKVRVWGVWTKVYIGQAV